MKEGTILYIYDYVFEDGQSKNKYFLVIKDIEKQNSILIALPSSKDYIPATTPVKHGCIDLSSVANQTTYCFKAGQIVTEDTSFSFDLNTFLYGAYLKILETQSFNEKYPVEGVHYDYIGKLYDKELQAVIKCFKEAESVKNKYKKLL